MNLTLRKAFLETAISVKKTSTARKDKLTEILSIEKDLEIALKLFENIAAKHTIPVRILLRIQNKIEELIKKTNKIKKRVS